MEEARPTKNSGQYKPTAAFHLKIYLCEWAVFIHIIHAGNHHHHNRFTALFPAPPGWAGARRELLDFMVQ